MTQTTLQNKPPRLFHLLVTAQNPFMKWLLRSPFQFIVSRMYLLMTFTGRKSGQTYTTPVQYAQQGKCLCIITSEGYTWWKNLQGGSDVQVHLRGKTYQGHAETSSDSNVISTLIQKIYPGLSSKQHTHFVLGKVVITVALQAKK
jgi:deazaflavin-dependent oxidoreductase (nitroreductase family)